MIATNFTLSSMSNLPRDWGGGLTFINDFPSIVKRTYAPVIVMTLEGGTRDRPGSFVKDYLTDQRQFVILRFPAGGKFAITAHVENFSPLPSEGGGREGSNL